MKNFSYLFAFFVTFSIYSRAADKAPLDGELVYRNNCTRCHTTIHTLPEGTMATVVRHMRVRATLTEAEAAAVLKYLAESSPARPASQNRAKKTQTAQK